MTSEVVASSLKKGGYVIIDNQPCKISETTRNDGEIKITAIHLFDRKKNYQKTFSTNNNIKVPVVNKSSFQLAYPPFHPTEQNMN